MNTCPLLSGLCRYGLGLNQAYVSYIQITIMIIGMVFGILLMWQPRKLINIEIALYKAFDWELKPVSMERQVRNTRTMGVIVFVVALVLLILVYRNQF